MNDTARGGEAIEPLPLHALYQPSLALLTDLYQLSMAHGYWKSGAREQK